MQTASLDHAPRDAQETVDAHGATISAAAPIVPVRNLAGALAFYEGALGFRVLQRNPGNSAALVERGGMRLMLLRSGDLKALQATREHLSAYVWVDDLDRLWAEVEPALARLPAHRVRPPFRQPYGMREFHVKDPDGFLLFFGENPAARPN